MRTPFQQILSLAILMTSLISSTPAHATLWQENSAQISYPVLETQQANDEQEVTALIATLQTLPNDLATRLEYASRYFIGRPYLVGGPLGEGPNAEYDQDPLFRMDGFDCTTYVETTNALARARDYDDFMQQLLHLRYLNGDISFTTRNHFVELDWNPNNIAAGFFQEFTRRVGTPSDQQTAIQSFSKKTWYENLLPSALHIEGATPELLSERLDQLHHEGDVFGDVAVTSFLPYVLKESLPRASLKATLPTPAIFNIVRDVPGATPSLPSTRMVTHQMLLLKINGVLHIRQASSKTSTMKVIDSTYDAYIASLQTSTITKGINILKILPRP